MGLFRPDRGERGQDPWLDIKIGLFFLAAVLGIAGILTGSPWVVYAAILVIVLGLLLRWVPRGGQGREDDAG